MKYIKYGIIFTRILFNKKYISVGPATQKADNF